MRFHSLITLTKATVGEGLLSFFQVNPGRPRRAYEWAKYLKENPDGTNATTHSNTGNKTNTIDLKTLNEFHNPPSPVPETGKLISFRPTGPWKGRVIVKKLLPITVNAVVFLDIDLKFEDL